MNDVRLDRLPRHARDHLMRLCDALEAGFERDLVGVLVYGSLARGGFDPDRSDIDLVIVVRKDDREHLFAVGGALELARHAARIEPIVLRLDELRSAADVFPLLYDDIRSRNIVLRGENPFAGLQILDEHRRLRIEQELREARIRLRRVAAESVSVPRMLAGAVERKLKQMRGPLHALATLRGFAGDDDAAAVISACAKQYQLDLTGLARVRDQPLEAYDAMVRLLEAAIADVDHVANEEVA
ncbi:MAG: nucleotidyltransferase domain-containing protein [Deltaproteobacteria bacterium]|nr:nucleotidyltransferase domain-containing protein [Deltaproteobacteria bacterium]MBK8715546.1 nucleotidyltransferase domain-containing protein [Deltaproteobacteria bacterium]MBP7288446.1 nucleotidyltransferase domain-containing protein [Nannocystaceae bacterium]